MIQLNETDLVNHAAPYRGPVDAVRICLRKYVDLDGRASRSELWWFALFILLCEVCMIAMRMMWEDWRSYMLPWMPEFIVFATFVLPATAVAARRLHDTGRGDMRLLFFFLPAAMLISTMVYRGGIHISDLHPALYELSRGRVLMVYLVFGYGVLATLAFNFILHLIALALMLVPVWMLVAMYIPLTTSAYWWAKKDKATRNGFYFDGLPMHKKLFILPMLAMPVLYGLYILRPVSGAVEFFLFAAPAVMIPVVTFTYWWIQQGNPAQNKYDQTKTSPRKKLLIAKLPMAVVIYTAILLICDFLLGAINI